MDVNGPGGVFFVVVVGVVVVVVGLVVGVAAAATNVEAGSYFGLSFFLLLFVRKELLVISRTNLFDAR